MHSQAGQSKELREKNEGVPRNDKGRKRRRKKCRSKNE